MKNNYRLLVDPWPLARRLLTASVAVVYGATNVVFSHAAESNFWAERRKAAQRSSSNGGILLAQANRPLENVFKVLPYAPLERGVSMGKLVSTGGLWLPQIAPTVGEIRSVQVAPTKSDAPTVFLIQDIHEIYGAQRNISSLIETISSHQTAGGALVVGLEGAVGAFHLDPFLRYKDEPYAPTVARILLKSNQISGPEHFALATKNPATLWGIEDPALYKENVRALRESAKGRADFDRWLHVQEIRLNSLEVAKIPPAFRELAHGLNGMAQGTRDVASYVGLLERFRPRHSFKNIRQLQLALEIEKSLDFARADQERRSLMETVAQKATETEVQSLLQLSLAVRDQSSGYSLLYSNLKALCDIKKIAWTSFPNFARYVRYVDIAEKIDKFALFKELDALRDDVLTHATQDPVTQEYLWLSFDLGLLRLLRRQELGPTDWEHFNYRQTAIYEFEKRLTALLPNKQEEMVPPLREMAPLFEKFYSVAIKRNDAMVSALAHKAEQAKAKQLVLVAGGFHSEALQTGLVQKGFSVVTITPTLREVPKDHRALDIFEVCHIPLEKMLLGEKLYLSAYHPLSDPINLPFARTRKTLGALFLALTVGLATVWGTNPEQIQQDIRKGIPEITARIDVQTKGPLVDVRMQDNKEIIHLQMARGIPAENFGRTANMEVLDKENDTVVVKIDHETSSESRGISGMVPARMKAALQGLMEEGLFRGSFAGGGVAIAQWIGIVDPFVGMILGGLLGAILFSNVHWRKVRFLQDGKIVERDATPMDRLTHLALNVGLTALFAVVFYWVSPLMFGATGGTMEKALLATLSGGIGHGLLYNAWLAPSLGLALGMAGRKNQPRELALIKKQLRKWLEEPKEANLEEHPPLNFGLLDENGNVVNLTIYQLRMLEWSQTEDGKLTAESRTNGILSITVLWLRNHIQQLDSESRDTEEILFALLPALLPILTETDRSILEDDVRQLFPQDGQRVLGRLYGEAIFYQLHFFREVTAEDRMGAEELIRKAKQFTDEEGWQKIAKGLQDVFLEYFDVGNFGRGAHLVLLGRKKFIESTGEIEGFLGDLLGPEIRETILNRYIKIYRETLLDPFSRWPKLFREAIVRLSPDSANSILKHEDDMAISRISSSKNIAMRIKIIMFENLLNSGSAGTIFQRILSYFKQTEIDPNSIGSAMDLLFDALRIEMGTWKDFGSTELAIDLNHILRLGSKHPETRINIIQALDRLQSSWDDLNRFTIVREMSLWMATPFRDAQEAIVALTISLFTPIHSVSPEKLNRYFRSSFGSSPVALEALAETIVRLGQTQEIPDWFRELVHTPQEQMEQKPVALWKSWTTLKNGVYTATAPPPWELVDLSRFKDLKNQAASFERYRVARVRELQGRMATHVPPILWLGELMTKSRDLFMLRSVLNDEKVIDAIVKILSQVPENIGKLLTEFEFIAKLQTLFMRNTISLWLATESTPGEAIDLAHQMQELMVLADHLVKTTQERFRNQEGGQYNEEDVQEVAGWVEYFSHQLYHFGIARGVRSISLEAGNALFGLILIRHRIERAAFSLSASGRAKVLENFDGMIYDLIEDRSVAVHRIQDMTGALEYLYHHVSPNRFLELWDPVGFEIVSGNFPTDKVPVLVPFFAPGKRGGPRLVSELPNLIIEGFVFDEDTLGLLSNNKTAQEIYSLAKEHLVSNKTFLLEYINAEPSQRRVLLSSWREATESMRRSQKLNPQNPFDRFIGYRLVRLESDENWVYYRSMDYTRTSFFPCAGFRRLLDILAEEPRNEEALSDLLSHHAWPPALLNLFSLKTVYRTDGFGTGVAQTPETPMGLFEDGTLFEEFLGDGDRLVSIVREKINSNPDQANDWISAALTVAWGLQKRETSLRLLELIFRLDPVRQRAAYDRSRSLLVQSYGVFEAEELLARLRILDGTGRASLADLRHAHEMASLYGDLGIPEVGGKLQIYSPPARAPAIRERAKQLGLSVIQHEYGDLDVVTVLLPPTISADQAGEIVERALQGLLPLLDGLTVEHQIAFGGDLGDRAKSAALSRYIAVPPGSRVLPPVRAPFKYPGDTMGLLIPGGGVIKPAHPAFEDRNGARTDFRGRTIEAATIPRLLANRAISADIQNIQMLMAGLKNTRGTSQDEWRQQAARAYERFEKEMGFVLYELCDGNVNDPALVLLNLPWLGNSRWQSLFPSVSALYEHLAGESEQRAGSPTWRRVSEARNRAVTEIQNALTGPLRKRLSSSMLAQIIGQRGVQEEIQRWDNEHDIIQGTLAQTVLISVLGARLPDQDDFPIYTLAELQKQTGLSRGVLQNALDALVVGHGTLPPQIVMIRGGRDLRYRIHSSEPGRTATGETPIASPKNGSAVVVDIPNGPRLRWVSRKEGQPRDVLSASKSFAILHWVLANHFDFAKAAIARAIPGAHFESDDIVAIDFIYSTSGSHKDVFEVVITLNGGKQIDSKFTVAYKQAIAGQDFEPGELEMLQSLESSGLVPRFGGQFKAYYLNPTPESRTSIISEQDYLARVSKGRSPPSADEFSIYIEEFIHGPTAQQLHEKGMLTSAHRAAVAVAYLRIWKQNNGRAPKDIHRGNWMFKDANDPTTVVMVDLGQVVPMTPQRVLEQLLIYFGYINDSFSSQANWGIYQAILGTLGEKEGASFLEEAGRNMGTHRIKKRIENVALTRRAIEKRSTFFSRLQSLVKQVDPEKRTKILSQINRNFKIRRQLAEKERKLLSSLPARIDQLNDMWDFLRSRGIQTPPPLSMELEKGTNFPLLLVENILIPFAVGLTSFLISGMVLGFDLSLFDLVVGGGVGLIAGITPHEASHWLTARMGTGQWTSFHLTAKWIGIRMNENDHPRWHRAIALAGPVGGFLSIPFLLLGFSPIGLSLAPTALLAATVVVASMNIASLLRGDGEVVFAKKSMTLRALLAASPSAAPLLNDLHAPFRQILDMPVGRAREEFPNAVGSTLVGLQRSRSVFTAQILAVATALFVSASDPSLATLRETVERATQTEYEDIPAVLHDPSMVHLPGQIPLYKMIVNQENLESVNALLNVLAQQRKSDSENPVQALLVPADKNVAMVLSRWNESADFVTIVPPPIGIVNGEIIDVQLCDQMIRAWAVSRGVTDMKAISLRWVLPKGYYWNFNDMESLGNSPLRQAALIILNQAFPLLGRVVDIQNAFRQAERMAQQA